MVAILSVMSFDELLAFDFAGFGIHQQGNNQAVETQHFGEDENQNHSDEKTWLLCCSTDTSITDDTNCKSIARSEKSRYLIGTNIPCCQT